ncbi:RdgB/HAM1 family non-canonical purine NTP pyrophosphatase [Bacteroides acidifaciens]|uniref:RdgB/HAM1 family non-canonical purine NTP pyrophosphatase n=1 Tax=Bacteroides acidifaciens TaxID=85831 RepID=UPI0025A4E42D|nr:RdgB/HAM1 family non-canonical purine NTP pyrophosphatase [Bacteroides acidifaciens]
MVSHTGLESLVMATNNAHKLAEIRRIIGQKIKILSLDDIGCHDEIPETGDTLEENALIKARWVKEKYGYDCFADDTGLEVDALGGAPGVYSARYAGEHCTPADNVALILERMYGIAVRSARFRTVIALIIGNEEILVDGVVNGCITAEPSGMDGFGYDPVFKPEGSDITFAQMDADAKNAISHRGRATARLLSVLNERFI